MLHELEVPKGNCSKHKSLHKVLNTVGVTRAEIACIVPFDHQSVSQHPGQESDSRIRLHVQGYLWCFSPLSIGLLTCRSSLELLLQKLLSQHLKLETLLLVININKAFSTACE